MNKIDEFREVKNFSYRELAEETGLTAPYLCLLAKEKRKNPSLETMTKISKALGATISEVFLES